MDWGGACWRVVRPPPPFLSPLSWEWGLCADCDYSPTLDLQQLATHARDSSLLTADDIAITVLAEVASGNPPPSFPLTIHQTLTPPSLPLPRFLGHLRSPHHRGLPRPRPRARRRQRRPARPRLLRLGLPHALGPCASGEAAGTSPGRVPARARRVAGGTDQPGARDPDVARRGRGRGAAGGGGPGEGVAEP